MLLLPDVFEDFRKVSRAKYELDLAHYYSSPGLSWNTLLKKTGIELELMTDQDMHLFIEIGMRGGISMVSKRHAKANNPLVETYDPRKPNTSQTFCAWAYSSSVLLLPFSFECNNSFAGSFASSNLLKQSMYSYG